MAKWSFMHEWWRLLQLSKLLEVTTKRLRGTQQFAFSALTILAPMPGRRAKSLWRQQRDALELVFLQLTADRHAFMEMARKFCLAEEGTDTVWGDFHADEFVPCRTELRLSDQYVEHSGDPTWALCLLAALVEPVALQDRSRRFRTARAKILSVVDAPMRAVCERYTIPLTIGLWFSDDRIACAVLESVSKSKITMDSVLATCSDNAEEEERRAALRVFPFRIATLDVTIDKMSVTPLFQSTLNQVVTTPGLQLQSLNYSSRQKLSKATFGGLMRTLVVGPARTHVEADLHFSHELIRPKVATLTATQLTQAFSALLEPSRFTSLSIMDVMDSYSTSNRRWVWLWLLHALFSASAVHSITYFELHIKHLTQNDMTAFREYLSSRNPVAMLCQPSWRFVGRQDPALQPPKRAALPKGATLLLNPSRRRNPESTALDTTGWFDVIQEDTEFVDVVVPGYGQCRVHKSDVTQWQVLPHAEPRTKFETHRIESLKIWIHRHFRQHGEFGDDGSAALLTLLELVGHPAVSLDLWCRIPRSTEFLDSVWTNCPHLQVLQAHKIHLHNLLYVVDAFETDRCRVPSLQFAMCPVHDGNSIIEFTQALGDPTKKITRVLREFAFGECPYHVLFTDEDVKDLVKMLSKNNTLRYFALDMEPGELLKYEHLFTPHHGQILDGVSERLPVECKSAFLSVVDEANDPVKATSMVPTAPLIALFDSSILSSIFQFCARPVVRAAVLKDY